MLTQETKRHIDAARQVLVGVVPNPTSQIDQITNALIYKFMDDMDQLAIRAGGDPSFFVGDLEQYSWTKLMNSRLGNQERMNLYSEALVKFSEAKQLPALFRGIFKSALLPYRSPEVLGLFLKEIDYFDYSHSEELGNAYEYLLSIMSSQGDAGQFRTPRHIIDFIVRVVNPTKDDKVLDPACGTAGFLVSAYKHILEQHDGVDEKGNKNNEKPLTPDERRALMNNFEGYDVDPGMVRISQVNTYLHNFKNPRIYNYNTLAQEERWGDKFNVILANPPFMTPKGGVSTHKRFSIQSKKAEALFVDYILQHLNPRGKAGIVVPEGILENDGRDFSRLRKLLIDSGLYAVVSLPIGTFNPYSGTIKTSILFIDKNIAEKNDQILHFQVNHDGFDLGKNRSSIDLNDFPEAGRIIKAFHATLFSGEPLTTCSSNVTFFNKIEVLKNKTFSLNLKTYNLSESKFLKDLKIIGQLFDIEKGKLQSSKNKAGKYNFITASEDWKTHETYTHDCEALIFAMGASGSLGRTHYVKGKFITSDLCFILIPKKNSLEKIDLRFYYHFFVLERDRIVADLARGAAKKAINKRNFQAYKIPYLPYEKQKEIVSSIESLASEIAKEKELIRKHEASIFNMENNIRKLMLEG
ncbi:MAG: N-6 DNA methylase [Candidatus Omnitrophica bacterium]|nr:N-6 DNA methylase [Candidatus Omnitrophota bacterium]